MAAWGREAPWKWCWGQGCSQPRRVSVVGGDPAERLRLDRGVGRGSQAWHGGQWGWVAWKGGWEVIPWLAGQGSVAICGLALSLNGPVSRPPTPTHPLGRPDRLLGREGRGRRQTCGTRLPKTPTPQTNPPTQTPPTSQPQPADRHLQPGDAQPASRVPPTTFPHLPPCLGNPRSVAGLLVPSRLAGPAPAQ